jgi:hypothetical protein
MKLSTIVWWGCWIGVLWTLHKNDVLYDAITVSTDPLVSARVTAQLVKNAIQIGLFIAAAFSWRESK